MYIAYSQTSTNSSLHRSARASNQVASRRRMVRTIVRYVVIAAILCAVFSFGAIVQAYAGDGGAANPNASTSTVTVAKAKVQEKIVIQQGDTLWSIAQAHVSKERDVRTYVEKLKTLNHLKSSALQEGQVLLLP
ncbi:LysM peptidoglycan-binding domain-containing protein [Paenibacillus whitsoniae]|nr:LysM peptidoglycan-binding domain-containing protein [Paenibacillus whitsoniae]